MTESTKLSRLPVHPPGNKTASIPMYFDPDDAPSLPTPPFISKSMIDGSDNLRKGQLIRIAPGGPVYRISMVNSSRAHCVLAKNSLEAEGDGINISVRSVVMRVTEEEFASKEPSPRSIEMATAQTQTAGIPIATKSNRQQEKDRRASLAAKKSNGSNGATVKPRAEKAAKTVRQCLCGCGDETMSYFVPGHDARFKGWMKRIETGKMEVKELPKAVQKAYEFKQTKVGFVTTTNYKGEPHKGYSL